MHNKSALHTQTCKNRHDKSKGDVPKLGKFSEFAINIEKKWTKTAIYERKRVNNDERK